MRMNMYAEGAYRASTAGYCLSTVVRCALKIAQLCVVQRWRRRHWRLAMLLLYVVSIERHLPRREPGGAQHHQQRQQQ